MLGLDVFPGGHLVLTEPGSGGSVPQTPRWEALRRLPKPTRACWLFVIGNPYALYICQWLRGRGL
jgi:hypothetical protein